MCTYNAISSHTDHFEIHKRDSEESVLTFVNLFPSNLIINLKMTNIAKHKLHVIKICPFFLMPGEF